MKTINREAYLAFARDILPEEQTFIAKYQEWLPAIIIDSHAHCNLPQHVRHIDDRTYKHMLSTFPSFSLEESREWNAQFHPQKTILTLRFPKVFRGINHKEANSYLLKQSPEYDRVALYGLSDEINYTIEALNHPRVSALKMYHSYPEPTAKKIYQYFPKEILGAAQNNNIPIILHPPVQITDCIDQVLRLIDDFPNLKICLAHIGLTKSLAAGLEKTLAALAQNPLVVFDTALVPSADVVEAAISIAGANKIMYGSDAPLHLVRSTAYQHPQNGRRLATKFPYHWADPDEHKKYGHIAARATHNHWQALEAIKEAISRFPEKDQEDIKQKVFYNNAKLFYGF